MGRVTALKKADGGVRRIVFSDVLRRSDNCETVRIVLREGDSPFPTCVENTSWLCMRLARPPDVQRSGSQCDHPVSGWSWSLRSDVPQRYDARVDGHGRW